MTYAEKIGPDDRKLDLSDPKAAVDRVRALSPHIGARAELDGRAGDGLARARSRTGALSGPVEVQPDGPGTAA